MKTNYETKQQRGVSLAQACFGACQKIIQQIGKIRQSLLAEFRETVGGNERLAVLSLNEAEALAAQTGYPHLLFPVLAAEKVQAVSRWALHQESVRQRQLAHHRIGSLV